MAADENNDLSSDRSPADPLPELSEPNPDTPAAPEATRPSLPGLERPSIEEAIRTGERLNNALKAAAAGVRPILPCAVGRTSHLAAIGKLFPGLPDDLREVLAAAELDAQSIVDGSQQRAEWLQQLGGERAFGNRLLLEAAELQEYHGRLGAADFLFRVAARVCWKHLLDVEAFIAKLPEVWQWTFSRFGIASSIPTAHTQDSPTGRISTGP